MDDWHRFQFPMMEWQPLYLGALRSHMDSRAQTSRRLADSTLPQSSVGERVQIPEDSWGTGIFPL